MAGETPLTVVGNLTADPELRFTPSGKAVTVFTVASTPRRWNSATQTFEDGQALFMRCEMWGTLAENVATSLSKGNRVIVTGEVVQESWETKEGERRSSLKLRASAVGAELTWAIASLQRSAPQQGAPQQQSSQGQQQAQGWNNTSQQQSPQGQGGWQNQDQSAWAPQAQQNSGAWGGHQSNHAMGEQPPF